MWHDRGKKHINLSSRRSACVVPPVQIHLLMSYLLTVELPVLVYGDRGSSVHEGLDVGKEGLVADGDVATDVFTSVSGIILILW